jgi:Na+-transporting methylmalonyl-CoA/oxaloacetate decarboxylase gamma subunit
MNFNLENLMFAAEHLAGFAIVMLALSLLWGLTALLGRLVARTEQRQVQSPVVATVPTTGFVPTENEIPEDDLVVIAATVAMMVDGRHRVVAVNPVPSSWGQQGRREIHASHRIR